MKPVLIYLVVLASIFGQRGDAKLSADDTAVAEKLYLELGRFLLPEYRSGKRSLSEKERTLIIEFLRDQVDYTTERFPKYAEAETRGAVADMAILGDEAALQKLVKSYIANETGGVPGEILLIKNPKIIPLLGETLFKEEKPKIAGDLIFLPPQQSVAYVIAQNLLNSNEFSPDVVKWARRLQPNMKPDSSIPLLRKWYVANESKLKAGDYKAVVAGDDLAETRSPSNTGTVPQQLAMPAPLQQQEPAKASAPAAFGNGYLWGSVAILGVGGLVWKVISKRD